MMHRSALYIGILSVLLVGSLQKLQAETLYEKLSSLFSSQPKLPLAIQQSINALFVQEIGIPLPDPDDVDAIDKDIAQKNRELRCRSLSYHPDNWKDVNKNALNYLRNMGFIKQKIEELQSSTMRDCQKITLKYHILQTSAKDRVVIKEPCPTNDVTEVFSQKVKCYFLRLGKREMVEISSVDSREELIHGSHVGIWDIRIKYEVKSLFPDTNIGKNSYTLNIRYLRDPRTAAWAADGFEWSDNGSDAFLHKYSEPVIGGPFTLINHQGQRTSDAVFRGKLMLIYFGYTHCPDICPATLSIISQALSALGNKSEKVVPIFITVDPERDTASQLSQYLDNFGKSFVGLTGSQDEIHAIANSYNVKYNELGSYRKEIYLIDHTSYVYLMDEEGGFVTKFTYGEAPKIIAEKIYQRLEVKH